MSARYGEERYGIRRQDISVLFLYYLGYSKIRNFAHRLKNIPLTRFVTFHDITPSSLMAFDRKLRFLKKNTNVVSLDDFFQGRLSSKKINVVITFDDGYKGWICNAIPALKKYEFPAVFFISSGLVGLSKDVEEEFIRTKLFKNTKRKNTTGGLSCEDLRNIVDEGFIVGGHTINHYNLADQWDSDRVKCEIIEDKTKLEKITGRTIYYFAYPSGDYCNELIDVQKILKQANYKAAVTTEAGFNSARTNLYLLHRELTSASMPWRIFRARVYGNYDAISVMKQWARQANKWLWNTEVAHGN